MEMNCVHMITDHEDFDDLRVEYPIGCQLGYTKCKGCSQYAPDDGGVYVVDRCDPPF